MLGLGLALDLTPTGARSAGVIDSLPLQANGSGITMSSLGSDGYYTVTTDASGASRSVGSVDSLSGDLLMEIVPLAPPPNTMFGFRASAPAFASSYADADARENLQTEGGGGGPNWVATFKQGVYGADALPNGRNGNLFMERVGTAWKIYTGTGDFGSSTLILTKTAVDAAVRWLAITDIGNNANFKIRFRAHP